MKAEPLFYDGEDVDQEYRYIRDFFPYVRESLEKNWQVFCELGLSDPGYKQRKEAQANFHGVFWELHLAQLLLRQGFSLFKPDIHGGPDFGFEYKGQKIYIEATVAKSGEYDKPDSITEKVVYESEIGSILAPNEDGIVQFEPIALRIMNSICCKKKQYEKWKYADKENACYIIAINGKKVSHFIQPLDIYRAVFGLGDLVQNGIGSLYYKHKDNISKSNGSPVSINIFQNNEFENISGILFSLVHCLNHSPTFFIPNPYAKRKLPQGIFDFLLNNHA